jgi:hypothetical protein
MMPEEFDDEYERHMMWAHLASGGAGCGMRWPARHPHVLTTGTRRSIGAMAAFVKQLEWRCFAPRDAVADVEIGTPGFEVFACRDDQQAIVWLLRQAPAGTVESCRSAIRSTMCGSKCAAWCRASTRCSCGTRAHGRSFENLRGLADNQRNLHFTLPELKNDLALAIRPAAKQWSKRSRLGHAVSEPSCAHGLEEKG